MNWDELDELDELDDLDQLDDLMMNIWDEHSIKMNILDKHIRWAS